MMDRTRAVELLEAHIPNHNLIKHCLATEAIMRVLAPRFGADPDLWGVTGLLHDLDYQNTKDDPPRHTLVTAELLSGEDLPPEAVSAIREHNAEALGIARETPFGIALTASESITGLIVASALVLPDKKIALVKGKSVKKRMKEKAFARNVNRDHIRLCETIDIPLEEFIDLSLEAMAGISDQLGL